MFLLSVCGDTVAFVVQAEGDARRQASREGLALQAGGLHQKAAPPELTILRPWHLTISHPAQK